MKSIHKVLTSLLTGLLTTLLAITLIITNGFVNEINTNQSFSVSYASDSQNDIQKFITIEKLVCRYINGHKRCWHE